MELFPAIANSAWLAASWRGHGRFRRALRAPGEAQAAVLHRILARQADTVFGRSHGLAEIQSYGDFARRVPLREYEEIEPWIRRIQRGEKHVLTRDPVHHLIPTSGSTGARKLIPFTAGLQADFNRALAPWIFDLFQREPGLVCGPAYWSISPAIREPAPEPSAVPIGFEDDSHYLGGARQWLVNRVMAVPSALRWVADMETFRYLTLRCLLRRRNLRLISVWHPSFLTLLLDGLPALWDELLCDLYRGEGERFDALPSAVRRSLDLRPLRNLAGQLRRADPRRPETIWPNLRLVSCWGDGHAAAAAAELARRLPKQKVQSKGLVATEAIVTLPFAGRHPVAVESHFFEFMGADGKIRLVQDLREGECYDVIVTTSGGLWRYPLHDRVQVTGFAARTPSLRFLGRSGNVSDRFGEKLAEAFVGEVLRTTFVAYSCSPGFAMLAPEKEEGIWRYVLFTDGFVPDEVVSCIEAGLRRNPHYDLCRELGQLGEMQTICVCGDAYARFVRREMEQGRRLGEIKPVALSGRENWREWFQVLEVGGCKPLPASSRWKSKR